MKLSKQSHSLSFEDEERLRRTEALGSSTPKQLVETLIYELGQHLSLRACERHCDLEFGENSQLSLCCESRGMRHVQYLSTSNEALKPENVSSRF